MSSMNDENVVILAERAKELEQGPTGMVFSGRFG